MSSNERKSKKPTSIIILDKLIFSCVSQVEDNFNYVAIHEPEYYHSDFQFGNTRLIRTTDPSNRYRYSYKVYYSKWLMGRIDFAPYFGSIYDMIRFKVDNRVFTNNTLKYIPKALNDLNLKINNFKQIDIAIGSCKINSELIIRRCVKNTNYTLKLLGDIVYDNDKILKEITGYHHPSRNNLYKLRSIYIKKGMTKRKIKDGENNSRQKKNEIAELVCYDKSEDIKEISNKEYISKFFKERNVRFKKIYWSELRFQYDEIRRYSIKIERVITFEDLLDPQFLCEMFFEYLDRMITVYEGTGRKRTKIELVDRPEFVQPQCILQPTLSDTILLSQQSDNKDNIIINSDKIKNSILNEYINQYKLQKYRHEIFINKISNNINNYKIYNTNSI